MSEGVVPNTDMANRWCAEYYQHTVHAGNDKCKENMNNGKGKSTKNILAGLPEASVQEYV